MYIDYFRLRNLQQKKMHLYCLLTNTILELQVLLLVARGYTSAQIADQMNIAPATVEVHRRNIMRKLDLHSVAELTRHVISRGLDRK